MDIQYLKRSLSGSYLIQANRICDLIGLHFASKPDGIEGDILYSFHIQCWMRILTKNRVVASSDEMYFALDYNNNDFHYDTDESLFDKNMRGFIKHHKTVPVANVEVNEYGDLVLHFDDESIIQVIASSSDDEDELWRFMAGKDQPHLIRGVTGFELSEE